MITLELIQKLREKTGLGMMDCKKALIESNGDIDKAIELLRKKGSLVAEKRSGNSTSCGIIHSYIHAGSQIGVLIEINCETDFVARTDAMKNLANDLCLHIAAMRPLYLNPSEVDKTLIDKEIEIIKEQLAASKKPESVINSIVDGKLNEYYADICLLNQVFIKNDKLTITEYINETIAKVGEKIKINRFVRFEIGH